MFNWYAEMKMHIDEYTPADWTEVYSFCFCRQYDKHVALTALDENV